MKTNY